MNLYVIRVDRNGSQQSSRPCDGCIDELRAMRYGGLIIKKIFYFGNGGKLMYENLDQMEKGHKSAGWRGVEETMKGRRQV